MNQNVSTGGSDAGREQTDTSRNTDSALIASDRVEGTKVFDVAGKHIGNIKSLKIDKVSGRVAYAVAEFGGFLGLGAQEYTIPWRVLDYDPKLGGFKTNLTKEQLEGAPDRQDSWRASAGGVGTGTRTGTTTTTATTTTAANPGSDGNDDDYWDRNRDRQLYDYYAVGYYWEE